MTAIWKNILVSLTKLHSESKVIINPKWNERLLHVLTVLLIFPNDLFGSQRRSVMWSAVYSKHKHKTTNKLNTPVLLQCTSPPNVRSKSWNNSNCCFVQTPNRVCKWSSIYHPQEHPDFFLTLCYWCLIPTLWIQATVSFVIKALKLWSGYPHHYTSSGICAQHQAPPKLKYPDHHITPLC